MRIDIRQKRNVHFIFEHVPDAATKNTIFLLFRRFFPVHNKILLYSILCWNVSNNSSEIAHVACKHFIFSCCVPSTFYTCHPTIISVSACSYIFLLPPTIAENLRYLRSFLILLLQVNLVWDRLRSVFFAARSSFNDSF